jgi:hypothetical protein
MEKASEFAKRWDKTVREHMQYPNSVSEVILSVCEYAESKMRPCPMCGGKARIGIENENIGSFKDGIQCSFCRFFIPTEVLDLKKVSQLNIDAFQAEEMGLILFSILAIYKWNSFCLKYGKAR